MLKLTGIGKMFGDRVVLKKISLETVPGTVSLLVGANGAGKTTLLKIMAGLIKPSTGTVECRCEQGELGYLGHATFLYPGLSALENLTFWSRLYGLGADRAHLLALLERVELARFAEERAGSFSRGMAQRLNLARILLQSPRILLLDEPGTGLDTRSLSLLRREIGEARAHGAVIVWISHDLAGDAPYADRILAIANKTLVYDGSPADWPGMEALLTLEHASGTSFPSDTGAASC